MKLFSVLLACAVSLPLIAPSTVLANETITVDQNFARERVVKLDVTPMGLVLDFGNSPISAVDLSHLREIIFRGMDGALCSAQAECPEGPRPTKLLLRKIPPIEFENEDPSPDRMAMLFVTTASGIYRFQLKPVEAQPQYTKINIETGTNYAQPGVILQ